MSNALRFDPEKYEKKTCELEGVSIRYREYRNLEYCEKPADPVQKLNLFVPEELAEGGEINGYTLKTAPIFMPNSVGGYMEGPADEPGRSFLGMVNAVFKALEHGYVVAAPGIRGRNTGAASGEFFVGGNAKNSEEKSGRLTGRAPAIIVDQKAVIRYLRHNKGLIPGDTEKIITSGTSAGGALSAMAGASGNSRDYEPYLKAIGAAEERDDIFAANCYCPIHNLENADAAYEWLFHGERVAHTVRFAQEDGRIRMIPADITLSDEDMKVSSELKALFPAYLNSLGLRDDQGNALTLDENGDGSFKDYVLSFVAASAEQELAEHRSRKLPPACRVPGSEAENTEALTIEGGRVTHVDFDKYAAKITRMKPAPSFDKLTLNSAENEEFGDTEVFARHFTEYSAAHSKAGGALADPAVIRLLNPTKYIGTCDTAKYWRIRHGSFDRDTSLAIPVILATLLKNKGYKVDFCLPWGVPHAGDYDLPELFAWIDGLCR